MKLEELQKRYKIGFRHNPSQFYPNSFSLEAGPKRLYVVGIVKRHVGKNFRVVGVVRRFKK